MKIQSMRKDLSLKVGNLLLAIWLSTVPTAITYAVLGMHGINICKNFAETTTLEDKENLKKLCYESSWQTTRTYILLIGFFITIPTWLWFYLSVKTKNNRARTREQPFDK